MKLMIASDIHGSSKYCRLMLDAFEKEAPDRLLLLGDLLYHGPRNGLPGEYDPKLVIEMLNRIRSSILCVKGNCDAEIDQVVLDFPIMAEYCILWLNEEKDSRRMVFATHGHHFHKNALPPMQPGDILLHGHTHVPAWEKIPLDEGTAWYFNPGSVSFPKEGSPHGYILLETEGSGTAVYWKSLDGSIYHELIL